VDVNPQFDRELSRLYRAACAEEPPARLDERVLAAARGDGETVRALQRSRWQVPLALAAVLVLAVSLTWVMQSELDRAAVPAVAVQ
jgi:hypothetical protein